MDEAAKIFGDNLSKRDILDFSISINPLGPPPGLMEAMALALKSISHYPEIDAKTLTNELAGYHNLSPDQIIAGNGSTDLLFSLIPLLPYKRAIIPHPSFIEYERACQVYGWSILHVPPQDTTRFALDVRETLYSITPEATLFLCRPNNPTGQCIDPDMLEEILDRAEKLGTFVILDEAFLPFTERATYIPRVSQHETLIILRSMTKTYAIPGLRLGYAAASPKIISRWRRYLPPWNVNAIAQAAGIYCLNHGKDYLDSSKAFIREERRRMADEIRKNSMFLPIQSEANFFLIFINSEVYTADDIFHYLGKRGIFVRHCGSFRGMGNKHIRIGIKNRKDNQTLIKALREFAGEIPITQTAAQASAKVTAT